MILLKTGVRGGESQYYNSLRNLSLKWTFSASKKHSMLLPLHHSGRKTCLPGVMLKFSKLL